MSTICCFALNPEMAIFEYTTCKCFLRNVSRTDFRWKYLADLITQQVCWEPCSKIRDQTGMPISKNGVIRMPELFLRILGYQKPSTLMVQTSFRASTLSRFGLFEQCAKKATFSLKCRITPLNDKMTLKIVQNEISPSQRLKILYF